MARKHKKSFDLFSSFGYWTPSVKGIVFLLLFLLGGVCVASFISLLLGKVCGPDFNTKYGLLITYPLQFIPAMLYASAMSHRNEDFSSAPDELDSYNCPSMGGPVAAVLGVLGTLALAVIVEPLMALMPEMPEKIKALIESIASGPLWVAFLSTAVFAPFFEEWLCRGMIMRGLLSRTSPTVAIMVSAAIFGIMHANPWQAVPAFLIGCLFGLVYLKTGSLKLTMLMHCANNSMSIILSQIPAFKENDYLYQVFSGNMPCYYAILALCLAVEVYVIYKFTSAADRVRPRQRP